MDNYSDFERITTLKPFPCSKISPPPYSVQFFGTSLHYWGSSQKIRRFPLLKHHKWSIAWQEERDRRQFLLLSYPVFIHPKSFAIPPSHTHNLDIRICPPLHIMPFIEARIKGSSSCLTLAYIRIVTWSLGVFLLSKIKPASKKSIQHSLLHSW